MERNVAGYMQDIAHGQETSNMGIQDGKQGLRLQQVTKTDVMLF